MRRSQELRLYVQPKDLFSSKDVSFIDVRDPRDFDLAHLPRAITCPALQVPLMAYLRNKKVILVGTGVDDQNHY
jgi:rhodanese-related sulfurtransferase